MRMRLATALRGVRLKNIAGASSSQPVQDALRLSGCQISNRIGVESELDELVRAGVLPAYQPRGELLSVEVAAGNARALSGPWPAACTPALAHPGLAGASRMARARGACLSVDTSLGAPPLSHIGGYYSRSRSTMAVAVDSSWHELVHEMTHASFEQRVHGNAGGTADPLRTHWLALRARGLSDDAAEEMVCREHELHALRAPGEAALQRAASALLVLDSALIEAISELEAVSPDSRSTPQREELRRMKTLRLFTGGGARVMYLFTAVAVATAIVSCMARWLGVAPNVPAAVPGNLTSAVTSDHQ